MPGSTKEEVVQAESELFTNLELKRNQAEAVLADETRLRLNVWVTRGYLTKLESAVSEYEQAVTVVLVTLESDSDQRAVYTTKLSEQLALMDPVVNWLHDAIDSFKCADNPPLEAVTAKRTARSISSIKLRIDSSRKLIKSKIDLVRDAEKEEGTLASLPKIRANLQLLKDVVVIMGKDINEICQQILKEDLDQGNIDVLMVEVAEVVESNLVVANGLKRKFLEVDAELRDISSNSGTSTPSTQASAGSDPHTLQFQDTLA